MSVRDFIREHRRVTVGGRPFTVSAPTFATVLRLLALYPRELWAVRTAIADAGDYAGDPIEEALPAFVADRRRIRLVLETCIDGDLDALSSAADLIALARAVLALVDVRRVIEDGIDLSQITDPDHESDEETPRHVGPNPQVLAIDRIARRYGVAPHEVTAWPYEQILACIEILNHEAGQIPADAPLIGPADIGPGGAYYGPAAGTPGGQKVEA